MSTHAISCRRDWIDLLTLIVSLLEPLFAFLLEVQPNRSQAPTPQAGSPVLEKAVAPTLAEAPREPVSLEAPTVGLVPASVTVAVLPEAIAQELPPVAQVEPLAQVKESLARVEPKPIAKTLPTLARREAPATPKPVEKLEARELENVFVKINGRFQPARAGCPGPKFRRVVKGNKPRFVPLPSTPSEKHFV